MAQETPQPIIAQPVPMAHSPWAPINSPVTQPPHVISTPSILQNGPVIQPPGPFPNGNVDYDMISLIVQLQRGAPLQFKDELTHAVNIIGYHPTVRMSHTPERAAQLAEAYRILARVAKITLEDLSKNARVHEQEQRRMSYQIVNMPNIPFNAAPQTASSGSFGVLNMRGNYPANHFPSAPHQRAMAPPIELPTFSFMPGNGQPIPMVHAAPIPGPPGPPGPPQYIPMQLPTPIPTPQEAAPEIPTETPDSSTSTPKKIKLTWKGKARAEAVANGQSGTKRKRKSTNSTNGTSEAPRGSPKDSPQDASMISAHSAEPNGSSSPEQETGPAKKTKGDKKGPAGWVPYSLDEFLKKD